MQTCPACNARNKDAANFCAFCGSKLAGILPTGTVLQARYRITQLLGKGGMGAVYQAQDQRLGNRSVAVKENFDASAEAQAQFQLEANMLANLNHSSLPRVIDHFIESSGKQYLVMDFVEGQNLDELVSQRGPLPESQALDWIDQVCDALEYMHSQSKPIIHRDIKPANVIVTSTGKAMLVDLGIAKVYDPGLKTATGARAVTPGFSSLEQYGQGATDTRSDVYSLGATLYFLLTGKAPPESIDIVSGTATVASSQSLNPNISASTEQVILQAMQLDARQRYQSVKDMRSAFTSTELCPSCSAPNRPSSKFCAKCGTPMKATTPQPGPTAIPAKPLIPGPKLTAAPPPGAETIDDNFVYDNFVKDNFV